MNSIHPIALVVLMIVAWSLLGYGAHLIFSRVFPRFAASHSPETAIALAVLGAAVIFAVLQSAGI